MLKRDSRQVTRQNWTVKRTRFIISDPFENSTLVSFFYIFTLSLKSFCSKHGEEDADPFLLSSLESILYSIEYCAYLLLRVSRDSTCAWVSVLPKHTLRGSHARYEEHSKRAVKRDSMKL